jgi:predicted Zn-dependent peptidase
MIADIRKTKAGLRTVFIPNPGSMAVHVAVLINTGSRDEPLLHTGISHFIEHMVFKGTPKRKAFHILNRLDSVGGEINAYTTKEQTCYYASVAKEHADRAVELLADILLNPTFPDAEIEKEKGVISEEIDMYQDYPEETILEDFESELFPGAALGKPILGTHESIKKFNHKILTQHRNAFYVADNIAVGICGDLSVDAAHHLLLRYFEAVSPKPAPVRSIVKPSAKHFSRTSEKSLQQAHVMLGGKAPSKNAKEQWALQILTNLLGGPAMNSRLNLAIREKHGLVYQISCFYTSYEDTGIAGIYFSADDKKRDKVLQLIHKELTPIVENGITEDALHKAFRQLSGNIRLQQDNKQSVLHHFLKESFQRNSLSPEDYILHLNSVNTNDILTVARKYLNPEKLNTVTYLPEKSGNN